MNAISYEGPSCKPPPHTYSITEWEYFLEIDHEGLCRIYSEGNRKPTDNHDKIYVLKRSFLLAAVWWVDYQMETSKDVVEVI